MPPRCNVQDYTHSKRPIFTLLPLLSSNVPMNVNHDLSCHTKQPFSLYALSHYDTLFITSHTEYNFEILLRTLIQHKFTAEVA